MPRRLGVALSGGGDSTALLLALREAAPQIAVTAYIVDHALRPESAEEARRAARMAHDAGASARILTWDAPRPGQGHARTARHSLLAEACRKDGVTLLCLAHTLEDRIETLRMRAARGGPEATLTGPGAFDPSPVWPEGRDLNLARPFLSLTRAQLRAYLASRGAGWIEDPSNADARYERVRLRQAPISDGAARALIERSDAARAAAAADAEAARGLIRRGAAMTGWGGAQLDRAAFDLPAAPARRAFEALLLAVSGAPSPPAPRLVTAGLEALNAGEAWTGAGAMLTPGGVLGRDPGAAGRKDARAAPALRLRPGETGVFDGRFEVAGPARVEMLGERRPEAGDLSKISGPFRRTLPFDADSGAVLAGPAGQDLVKARAIAAERISGRLMARTPPAWFDGVSAEARACAALAKPVLKSNMRL
ncbi:MAG: tRNA lysidine(34) synthetase TilS [Oceanicaulis sp.]